MDDFGSGYSSLGSLRSFPFDVLKIDRQFIEAIDSGDSGRQIVQAILTIGRALDLSVIAEGVERRSQLSLLVDDGCSEVQGFLLSRPVSAQRVTELVAMHQPAIFSWRAMDRRDASLSVAPPSARPAARNLHAAVSSQNSS